MSGALRASEIGPVDIAVIAFEGNDLNSEVAPALAELQANGTVHVIDLAFVRKDADGSTAIFELADDTVADAFDEVVDFQFDLLSESDLSDLAGALEPESSAMVVVWENSWASRFATAVRASHGRVAMLERIPHQNVERAITALDQDDPADRAAS